MGDTGGTMQMRVGKEMRNMEGSRGPESNVEIRKFGNGPKAGINLELRNAGTGPEPCRRYHEFGFDNLEPRKPIIP
jgi:hypothetical protein